MTATVLPFIVGDDNAVLLIFLLGFFIALSAAIDWCFLPKTERHLARQERRHQARRAEYRHRLIEAGRR